MQKDDILLEANGVVLRDYDQYRQLVQDTLGDKLEAKFDLKVVRAGAQLPVSLTLTNVNNGAAAIQNRANRRWWRRQKPS